MRRSNACLGFDLVLDLVYPLQWFDDLIDPRHMVVGQVRERGGQAIGGVWASII